MERIQRLLKMRILSDLREERSKINIIYWPRQVGKTTLSDEIIQELGIKTLRVNGDELKYNDILSSQSKTKLESLVSGYDMIFIDEAQRIVNIGINLKILYDSFPTLKILVTGSSSFDLANKIKEPLTGRAFSYNLYPLSFGELWQRYNDFELAHEFLETFLVYGSYPDVLLEKNIFTKKQKLQELATSYLYKDILQLEHIKHSDKLLKLLKLLAFQIGQEVSINELAKSLELGNETVNRYICLLEQSFIIHRLSWLSRNLRKEVSKMDKIYFWDLWVRNVIIDNVNDLENRNDIGWLWENFLINERLKSGSYAQRYFSQYFWRIYTGAEIDYIEEYSGKLHAFEFKWGDKKAPLPKSFTETYPDSEFQVVNRENFLNFIK